MRENLDRITSGDAAWLGLLAGVVAYDAWALAQSRETLSESFDRALRSPRRSLFTVAAWAVITEHLFDKAIRRIASGEPWGPTA